MLKSLVNVPRNKLNVAQFCESYPDEQFLQQAVAKISAICGPER
jgi:phage repressor protein C with HTH and peptisase S24 domain